MYYGPRGGVTRSSFCLSEEMITINSYEKMHAVLSGQTISPPPVTPHWWGLYRFQHAGMINGYDGEGLAWGTDSTRLADIDEQFYQRFKPDMFHLTTAPSKTPRSRAEIDELLVLRKQAAMLESAADIDRYIHAFGETTEQVLASGVFDHVKIHRERHGGEVLLALNEGADIACYFDTHVGFEDGCAGFIENPELTAYFLTALYDNTLNRMRALKACGVDAYINSETYCSSDVISPTHYREIIKPIQKHFYSELRKLDILPIGYFTGNILPILEDIKELDLAGMMVEESKKGFVLDVGELTHRIEKQFALFGNLDSYYILQTGSVEQVIAETKRQLDATRGYPFIMANGCPISFDTPPENIDAMISAVRLNTN